MLDKINDGLKRTIPVAAMLPALLSPAWASDRATVRDLPPLTPKGHSLIMTMSDETSTSKCIGKLVTPLCAVETALGCFLREDRRLCEMVGYQLSQHNYSPPPWSYHYLVTRALVIDDRHFPWPPLSMRFHDDDPPSVRAGDVRIQVRKKTCLGPRGTLCEDFYDSAEVFVVRKHDGWWQVMGWMPAKDLFR